MKTEAMSENDRKKLRIFLRLGIIICIIAWVITSLVFLGVKVRIIDTRFTGIQIVLTGFAFGLFLFWTINRNFLIDLKKGIKEIRIGVIDDRIFKKDYIAGSSAGMNFSGKNSFSYKSMNTFELYIFKIDKFEFRVEKELWDKAKKGDRVKMAFSPKTQELLSIELERAVNN